MAAGLSLNLKGSVMADSINIVTLNKDDQHFIFAFDDANRDETLRQLAKFAANPGIEFSWHDAAQLSQKIRQGNYEDQVGSLLLR